MTRVIAHRGASAEAPELTRAAFELAIALGADGVECDVRLTADGQVACFHDPTTDRTLGAPGEVAALTLAQLRELGEVMTLAELLTLAAQAGRPLTVAVELKHPNPYGLRLEAAVLAAIDAVDLRQATVSLMSFNPASVAALAPVDPAEVMILTSELVVADLDEGRLPPDAAAQLAAALAAGLALLDTAAVGGAGPDVAFCRAHPHRVRAWLNAGLTVRVWTADDPADVAFLLDLGVTEITTNDPRSVIAQLAAS